MIVAIRWVVSPYNDFERRLEFREENGDWQDVPEVDAPRVEGTPDAVHDTVRQLGSET